MNIFGRKPPPAPSIAHPALGLLLWSPEEKGWVASISQLVFCLSHEGESQPSAELLKYAESFLCPPALLLNSLQSEKRTWRAKYQTNEEEIAQLKYDQVIFYRQRGKNCVFGMLGPESEGRAWRIEFQEHKSTGLGFDS